eukprot:UN27236
MLPTSYQELLFAGKKLIDSSKLEKENMQSGNTIYVRLKTKSYTYLLCHFGEKKERLAMYYTTVLSKVCQTNIPKIKYRFTKRKEMAIVDVPKCKD